MSFLTSKVIWTPLRNQEYPPRFLGGHSGDAKENILFQCTEGPEILQIASLMFMHVILDVHSQYSHQYSIQESRISSETAWRTLWKLKGECPLPVHLEVWNFEQSFLNIYICYSGHPKSSTLHSGIKNVLQDSLKEALDPHKRMSSSSEPWGLTFCTELPKSLYISFLISKVC